MTCRLMIGWVAKQAKLADRSYQQKPANLLQMTQHCINQNPIRVTNTSHAKLTVIPNQLRNNWQLMVVVSQLTALRVRLYGRRRN